MTSNVVSSQNFEKIKEIISKVFDSNLDDFILVDRNVLENYSSFFPVSHNRLLIIPEGEDSKSLKMFDIISEQLLERGVHKNSHLYAIGGGVTTDLVGFIASTILRGISWSALPTTLLGMVDAAIGGKTGINSKLGKNLIGLIYPPVDVIIDIGFIDTLSGEHFRSGKGEILKYALLSKSINAMIREYRPLDEIIFACAEYKLQIVSNDLKEAGLRKILNLGHTYGHAVEKEQGLAHGLAVQEGLYLIDQHFMDGKFKREIDELSTLLGVGQRNPEYDFENLKPYLLKDKKRTSDSTIDVVLLKDIGEPQIKSIPLQML